MTSSLQRRKKLSKRICSCNDAIIKFKNMTTNSTDKIKVFFLNNYIEYYENLRAKTQDELDILEKYAQKIEEENYLYS